jgi:hypothetical protein
VGKELRERVNNGRGKAPAPPAQSGGGETGPSAAGSVSL